VAHAYKTLPCCTGMRWTEQSDQTTVSHTRRSECGSTAMEAGDSGEASDADGSSRTAPTSVPSLSSGLTPPADCSLGCHHGEGHRCRSVCRLLLLLLLTSSSPPPPVSAAPQRKKQRKRERATQKRGRRRSAVDGSCDGQRGGGKRKGGKEDGEDGAMHAKWAERGRAGLRSTEATRPGPGPSPSRQHSPSRCCSRIRVRHGSWPSAHVDPSVQRGPAVCALGEGDSRRVGGRCASTTPAAAAIRAHDPIGPAHLRIRVRLHSYAQSAILLARSPMRR